MPIPNDTSPLLLQLYNIRVMALSEDGNLP